MKKLLQNQEIKWWEVITVNERAKQFSAFSPLRGYSELLLSKERVIVPKHELTEESKYDISDKLNQLSKGMMVKLVYYSNGEYIEICGVVSKIDIYFKKLTIVKTLISFDDIYDLKIIV